MTDGECRVPSSQRLQAITGTVNRYPFSPVPDQARLSATYSGPSSDDLPGCFEYYCHQPGAKLIELDSLTFRIVPRRKGIKPPQVDPAAPVVDDYMMVLQSEERGDLVMVETQWYGLLNPEAGVWTNRRTARRVRETRQPGCGSK